jgi:cbb3-type cytochrome oxidase maturation protein
MAFYYMLVIGSIVLLGGSAVYALYWAASHGQFRQMERGAESIFDSGEPVGKVTDVFPGLDLAKEQERAKARKKKV